MPGRSRPHAHGGVWLRSQGHGGPGPRVTHPVAVPGPQGLEAGHMPMVRPSASLACSAPAAEAAGPEARRQECRARGASQPRRPPPPAWAGSPGKPPCRRQPGRRPHQIRAGRRPGATAQDCAGVVPGPWQSWGQPGGSGQAGRRATGGPRRRVRGRGRFLLGLFLSLPSTLISASIWVIARYSAPLLPFIQGGEHPSHWEETLSDSAQLLSAGGRAARIAQGQADFLP